MAAPVFIARDITTIRNEIVADYQARTGRTLQPSQVETFLLDAMAYRELLVRNAIQNAGELNLVGFSSGAHLEALADLVGVQRLGASAAACTLRFVLAVGHTGVTIPAATRVASLDGKAVFRTTQSAAAASGTTYIDVPAECEVVGEVGNGFAAGIINVLLDPRPFVVSAANLALTAGGADVETDDNLRERIQLAPSSFSNAGSYGAYKFWARTANANIVDVAVLNPTPGVVAIYPLMEDGQPTPSQIIAAVLAACSADNRRPLCDTVVVSSPTRVNYTLVVELTLYLSNPDPAQTVADVEAALQAFVDERRRKLGQDVVATQVIERAQIAGVYEVALPGFSNLIIAPTEFPYCTSINVQAVGSVLG
jgi:phage-related baseplate assembly protein